MRYQAKPVNELTPEKYYKELGNLNNHPSLISIDIVSYSALLNLDEKLKHYKNYVNRIEEAEMEEDKKRNRRRK